MNGMILGIDEAGRGPWAGPLVVGAVVLDPERPIAALDDSKKLTKNEERDSRSRLRMRHLRMDLVG